MFFISWCRTFLGTNSWVNFGIASTHSHLILNYLVLTSRNWILPTRHKVHVNFIDIRLVLQILFRTGLNAARAVLLIQVERILCSNITWPSGTHLILRGIPCLFHVGLDKDLWLINIARLLILISAIASHNDLIIPFNLLINSSLKLVGLINTVRQLLLLQVICCLTTWSIGTKSLSSSGLALSICICILACWRFLP